MKAQEWMWAGLISIALALPLRAASGIAQIKGTTPESTLTGTVKFEDTKDGLKISADIQGAPAGEHGFHIHEFGDCGDAGKSAGGHFNPDSKPHGQVMKDGLMKAHVGDLGNITINEQGNGKVNVVLPKATLTSGKYAVAGRAVIVHEKVDDFGQPTGNAGGRIACGPVLLVAPPTPK